MAGGVACTATNSASFAVRNSVKPGSRARYWTALLVWPRLGSNATVDDWARVARVLLSAAGSVTGYVEAGVGASSVGCGPVAADGRAA